MNLTTLDPLPLRLSPGRLTRRGHEFFGSFIDLERVRWEQSVIDASDVLPPIAGGSGTFSNYGETKLLGHLVGQSSYTSPTAYVCLLTVVPDSSKTLGALPSLGTGSTVTEAAFTSYARYSMSGGWSAPVSGGAGAASSITNSGTITMAGCTGGSSTVIAWCLGDVASSSGNVLAWGSATSVVISTTQTPPTIAASGLVVQLT